MAEQWPRDNPFEYAVDQVQDDVERDRPELFDRDGRVNEDTYVLEVVRRLRVKGYCATVGGPSDEIGVKGELPSALCESDPPVPAGPVAVTNGLRPSSCQSPGENSKCFRDGQGGADVPWEADERSCWSAATVAGQAGRIPKVLGGLALFCEPGYGSDLDDSARGCFDAYSRRYQFEGGRWVEQALSDRFSGWWLGICPPRQRTCQADPSVSYQFDIVLSNGRPRRQGYVAWCAPARF